MSFGKDDSHLGRIGTFGATTAQQMGNAGRRQQGPRKGAPPWAGNYTPSEGTPDLVRLIPGKYEAERIDEQTGAVFLEEVAWFEHTEHFHGGLKRSSICSAGVHRMSKDKAQPCRACTIFWEDFRERQRIEREKGVKPQGPKRISASSKYAFLVLDMGWFFKGVRTDNQGKAKTNSNTGQPFLDWIKYTGHHQDAEFSSSGEKRNGMVFPWPLNFTQFGTLSGYADIVQRHCKSCGGQNCIHTSGYTCPTCNAPTFRQQDSSVPPDRIKEIVSRPMPCWNCKNSNYPRATLSCMNCQYPAPSTLYDVDMQVQKVKVRENNNIIIPWMSGPRPVDQAYANALKYIPDLPKKFAPTPYEEQLQIYGEPQPTAVPQGQYVDPNQQHQNYYAQPPAYQQPPQGSWSQQPQQWQPPAPPQGQWPQQPQPQPQPQPQAWQPQAPQWQPQQPQQPQQWQPQQQPPAPSPYPGYPPYQQH